jgi:hypothetical protein
MICKAVLHVHRTRLQLFVIVEKALNKAVSHHTRSDQAASRACTGRRRMMWFQRENPGTAVGFWGEAGGFRSTEQGGVGGGSGAEREKESSANQAFRRSGRIVWQLK